MARRALVRGNLAALVSMGLAVGLGSSGTAAVADTGSQEVVVPAVYGSIVKTAQLRYVGSSSGWNADGAGVTGVFHTVELNPTQWTRYADGKGFPVPAPTIADVTSTVGTGTDAIAYYSATSRQVELVDMASGTTSVVEIPEGLTYLRTYASTVFAYGKVTAEDGTSVIQMHMLDAGQGGGTRDRVVTGMPAGATIGAPFAADATSVVFSGKIGGELRWILVDTATATVSSYTVPRTDTDATHVILTPGHLGWYATDGAVTVVPRAHVDAQPAEVALPASDGRANGTDVTIVGDRLVYRAASGGAIKAVPLSGGSATTLLARSTLQISVAADGTAAVIGGTGASDWGLRHVVEGADGTPSLTTAMDLSAPAAKVQGLALGQGQLVVTDSAAGPRYDYQRTLSTQGTLTYGDRVALGDGATVAGCAQGQEGCRASYALGDGRFARVISEGTSSTIAATGGRLGWSQKTVPPGGRITDANGAQGVYTVAATGKQYVWDFYGTAPTLERPATAAAVWAGALWTPGSTAGTVTALDLDTRKTTATVAVGSGCVPEELQVLGRWIYWSCGLHGKAGVYDRTAKRSVSVPADQALLGDGFVVTHDKAAGKLVLTDVHTATAASRTIGDLPDTGSDQRHLRWDVDKFTDRVAFADGAERVHVVAAGVPAQPLTVLDSSPGSTSGLYQWFVLSKPAASWKLVLKRKAGGATVRTMTGGEARGFLKADWDGHDDAGRLAPNGAYTWTLTAPPADAAGPAFTASGTFSVPDGDEVWRDFAGQDGLGELFAINGNGNVNVRTATGTGKLTPSWIGGIGWDPKAVLVPVGDMTGDNCNDFLVRLPSGSLYRYPGGCGGEYLGSRPGVRFGTGWNGYNVLTSAGDLSGDGRADLIARQASTSDVWLYKATSDGKLAVRVKLASKWTGYKKVVGAGDLNGDGFGDLLVQDKANVLWRYDGDGKGRLKPRVKLAANWGVSYNVLVGVGDITGDGKADLIARDTAGNLYRYDGTGKGTFGTRTKIGTGWNTFKGIF
ncbi:FG-GAP-like repeat-containing protein [Streptomyces sp. NBC_00510]